MAQVLYRFWYCNLHCERCGRLRDHRVREYQAKSLQELSATLGELIESGFENLNVVKEGARQWFFLYYEDGKIMIAQCAHCENEHFCKDISSEEYFWKMLSIKCKACGGLVEQNNAETVGYCRNEDCSPVPEVVFRWKYRCPECGGWEVGGNRRMRCVTCNAKFTSLVRTAC